MENLNKIIVNNKTYSYKVKRSNKYKNIIASFDINHILLIKCNNFVSDQYIYNFIKTKINEIDKLLVKKEQSNLVNLKNNYVFIFGNIYYLEWKSTDTKFKYQINNNIITIYIKDMEAKQKYLDKTLQKIAKPYIEERLYYWANKMNLSFNEFKMKWLNFAWGTCNFRKKSICISTRVVFHNKDIIDYILIHELSHLVYNNHSKEFWNLVGSYYLNYKSARNILKTRT